MLSKNKNLRTKALTVPNRLHDLNNSAAGYVDYSSKVNHSWNSAIRCLPRSWRKIKIYNNKQQSWISSYVMLTYFTLKNCKDLTKCCWRLRQVCCRWTKIINLKNSNSLVKFKNMKNKEKDYLSNKCNLKAESMK